jgi:regulator of sirC expression with transglutaminase-like and TPR domain
MMFLGLWLLMVSGAHAQNTPQSIKDAPKPSTSGAPPTDLSIIKDILMLPEDRVDLAQVELAVERIIDPSINEVATLHQIDLLAENARARFPQGDATDPEVKGMVLISTLRDAGPWNDQRPFRYDLDNPFGNNPKDKLISHYLATHLGNCVTMPVLFVILGQKLGLPVTLSTAPMHVFAKFRKDDGTWTNLELTSYGGQTDEHYQERMDISESAILHHLYLQPLTRKQSAQVIMDVLVEYYHQTQQAEQELALTDLLLHANPTDISAMIFRGDAFAQLADQRYKRYGDPENIPKSKWNDYIRLEHNNQAMFVRAETLGWTPETQKHKSDYLKLIQQVKAQGSVQ